MFIAVEVATAQHLYFSKASSAAKGFVALAYSDYNITLERCHLERPSANSRRHAVSQPLAVEHACSLQIQPGPSDWRVSRFHLHALVPNCPSWEWAEGPGRRPSLHGITGVTPSGREAEQEIYRL